VPVASFPDCSAARRGRQALAYYKREDSVQESYARASQSQHVSLAARIGQLRTGSSGLRSPHVERLNGALVLVVGEDSAATAGRATSERINSHETNQRSR
jgi:hypothetical protein